MSVRKYTNLLPRELSIHSESEVFEDYYGNDPEGGRTPRDSTDPYYYYNSDEDEAEAGPEEPPVTALYSNCPPPSKKETVVEVNLSAIPQELCFSETPAGANCDEKDATGEACGKRLESRFVCCIYLVAECDGGDLPLSV